MSPRVDDVPAALLVVSWHPEEGVVVAGGYRRSLAILERFVDRATVYVVDSQPSIYGEIGLGPGQLVEYALPGLEAVARRDQRIARAAQWSAAVGKIVRRGSSLRGRYDAIYVPNAEILPCAFAGFVLKKLTNTRLVMCNLNVGGVFDRPLMALHNRADAITVASQALKRALIARGVERPIEVTGIGSPRLEPARIVAGPIEKRWEGIYIGRHTPEKGIFDALTIWERVAAQASPARLVLVGACAPSVEKRIRARCEASPLLRGNVTLAGVVSESEKLQLLRAARVVLAPSHVEGWGFVPLEALAAGVPTVCWDLAVYEESLPSTDAIARVPIGDLNAFAARTLALLDGDEAGTFAPFEPVSTSWDEVAEREWEVIRAVGRAC